MNVLECMNSKCPLKSEMAGVSMYLWPYVKVNLSFESFTVHAFSCGFHWGCMYISWASASHVPFG